MENYYLNFVDKVFIIPKLPNRKKYSLFKIPTSSILNSFKTFSAKFAFVSSCPWFIKIPFKLLNSVCKTKRVIKKIKPSVIFCKGGFVSVPVAIAGHICKIPVIAHESDYSMGLANKIILKFASTICTTFEDTAKVSKKCICTGTPIRKQIFEGKKANVLNLFD